MRDLNATVIVDLGPSEAEIMHNLHKDARWGIKRAIREGLIVEETNKENDWKEFYNIYCDTMKEGGSGIETLEHLKEYAKVFFICKKNNEIIAGATLDIKDNKTHLSRNASLKKFWNLQPNNLLYWNCILWSKKKGFKELDLGGYQLNARGHLRGVNSFKEKWGKIVYYYKDYPFFIAIARKLLRNSQLLWWLNHKLKRRRV